MGNCPEYKGFNTKMCRDQRHYTKPKTKVVYLPLMNNSPSDPKTMMCSIMKAKRITSEAGQEYVVYTADQQLYRVALHLRGKILTFVTMDQVICIYWLHGLLNGSEWPERSPKLTVWRSEEDDDRQKVSRKCPCLQTTT